MNARPELTGIVGDWLRQDAVSAGSDRVLAAAIAQVAGTDQDRYVAQRVFGDAFGRLPLVRWGLLVVPLLVALAGAIVAGASLFPRTATLPGGSNGLIAYTKDFGCCGSVPTEIYLAKPGEMPVAAFPSPRRTSDRMCPSFSPGGDRIAYVETLGDGPAPPGWVVVADVGPAGHLTETARLPIETGGLSIERFLACPEWSPTGRQLAYLFKGELSLVDLDTSATRVIDPRPSVASSVPPGEVTDLAWSPDGRSLALAMRGILFVFSVERLDSTFSARLGSESYAALSWAPGGATIAALADENGHPAIRIYPIDGSVPFDVPTDSVEIPPVWSPDGRLLAYVDSGIVTIATLDRQRGRGLTPFVPTTGGPPAGIGSFLVWSPDGTRILYAVAKGDGSNDMSHNQWALVSISIAPGTTPEVVVPFGSDQVKPLSWQEVFP